MKDWKFIYIGLEGEKVGIDGINVWDHKGEGIKGDPIIVPHPSYPDQKHIMNQYQIQKDKKKIIFAAGEYSNGVWGFYVPA